VAFTLTQPLYGQGGSYTAQQDRLFIKATAVTQGVRKLTAASGGVMTGDLAVTSTGTTNGSVSVAAGEVIVAASTANYGHYFAVNDGATTVGSFTANSSGNPRIDLVTVLITDTGATPVVSFAIVAGTPAASPSAPATPSNSLALAQVSIPNGFTVSTTVAAGNITDVRQKAFVPDLSVTSTSATVIPSPTVGNTVFRTSDKTLNIYDGSAWVPVAATATTADVSGGLIYISTTNFSGGSTVQFTSCFTSTYTNYRAIFNYTTGAANAVYIRWLIGGTVQTGNNYSMQWGAQYSVGTWAGGTRGDQYMPLLAGYPTYPTTFNLDFYSPQALAYTSWTLGSGLLGTSATDAQIGVAASHNVATTQFDGFELTTAGATNLAGTMTLYGYRKA
jgi:hypothetical protein